MVSTLQISKSQVHPLNFLLALFFTILINPFYRAYSQDKASEVISLKEGPFFEDQSNKTVKIVGAYNDIIYGIGFKGKKKVYLNSYHKTSLDKIKSTEVVLPKYNKKKVEFYDIILLQDKLFILGTSFNSKTDVKVVLAYEVSLDGEIQKIPKVLSQSTINRKLTHSDLEIKFNRNRDKFIIIHAEYYKKVKSINYQCEIYDKHLTELFSTSEEINHEDKDSKYLLFLSDFEMNEMGDVFIMELGNAKEDNNRNIYFKLNVFKKDAGYKKTVISAEKSDISVINGRLVSIGNDEVKFVGLYNKVTEKGKVLNAIEGNFIISYDINALKPSPVLLHPLDQESKIKIIGESAVAKNSDSYPFYSIIDVKVNALNEIIMTYEQVVITESRDMKARLLGYNIVNGSSMLVNYTPNNEIKWINTIVKNQMNSKLIKEIISPYQLNNFNFGFSKMYCLSSLRHGVEYMGTTSFINEAGQFCILFNEFEGIVLNKKIIEVVYVNFKRYSKNLNVYNPDGSQQQIEGDLIDEKNKLFGTQVFYKLNDKEFIMKIGQKKSEKLSIITIK